ncbi:hypothetical protein PV703_31170 [Streptomyces sp. ME01-24h]|nr:hypothetical protein [Streptomyces sp. ME19-03-3]MDX3357679.1 hypothetical protein [Streptomyces sp. ME01-24h]
MLRRTPDGRRVRRPIAAIPTTDRNKTLRMARLHVDAGRSAALFAERLLVVEGVTEAAILRDFGRAWAGTDGAERSFVEALGTMYVGTEVGPWTSRSWRQMARQSAPARLYRATATSPSMNSPPRPPGRRTTIGT